MRARILVWFAVVVGICSASAAGPVSKTTTTARKATVWNAQAKIDDGSYKKIVFIGDAPKDMLPACRCVTGMWKLTRGGESATHFVGTLDAPSFNYAAAGAKKRLSIKVRKTRELMGVHRDYRPTLHALLRRSGQLVLREVTGGEWEVVGYAPEPVGKLFANNPSWKADDSEPPQPADAAPVIDPKADAVALAKLINDYRASIKLPRIPISASLTKVAQAHVRDLNVNKPVKEGCNLHSWSAQGSWSACCYDSSKEAARCMWAKPKEIASYAGNGYEIAANASGITPDYALEMWQNSPAHHEVMTNKKIWTKPWRAMGVAIEGDHAVAWFGEVTDSK
jgi:hypothetical protein